MRIKNKILGWFRWQSLIDSSHVIASMPSNREIITRTFKIAWPSAVESILIALIAAVDMMMVGGLGKEAVAAVGITSQPKMLILAVILSLNIGLTVLVSRRKGENDQESANRYLRHCVLISIGVSFTLSLLGFTFAEPLLSFAGANSDYLDLAVNYFKIIMIGNFFYSIGLTITAAQRGAGNTKISMKTNLAANFVNLFFNAMLINGLFFFPKLGVTGAAIATAIGNIVSLVIAFYSVTRKNGFLRLSFKDNWRFEKNVLLDIKQITTPTMVEQIFLRIGFFVYAMSVASLGTVEFSAHQVCMNVMTITFACGDGLQVAATSLVGQNLGAKRPDLAMVYSRLAQRVGLIVGITMCILITLFRGQIMYLFIQDMEVIAMGQVPMMILGITVLFQVPQVITVGSLRGAGDVKFVAVLMMISVAIVRPGLTIFLAYGCNLGLFGAWMGVLIDQFTRYMVSNYRFKQAKWMSISV
ncbi:MAG: MATE family efflux transporter [Erysipelotrichaceae bacterium]